MINKYFTKIKNYMQSTLDSAFLFFLLLILRINKSKNLLVQKIVLALKAIFSFLRNKINFINTAYNKIRIYSYKLIFNYVAKSAIKRVNSSIEHIKTKHSNAYYMALGSSMPTFLLFLKFATDKPTKSRKKIKLKLIDGNNKNHNDFKDISTKQKLYKPNESFVNNEIESETKKRDRAWLYILPNNKLSLNLHFYSSKINSDNLVKKATPKDKNLKIEQGATLSNFTPYYDNQFGIHNINIEKDMLTGLKSLRLNLTNNLSQPKPLETINNFNCYLPDFNNQTYNNHVSINNNVNLLNIGN